MIPSELVHYTTRETALEHILYKKEIMLSLLGKTNDPKETRPWKHNLFIPNNFARHQLMDFSKHIHEIANEIMLQEWKLLCLTKHSTNSRKNDGSDEFLKGYCHPRLWANYGGNHTGVCLLFDGKKLNRNIRDNLSNEHKVFHGSIKYNNLNAIAQYPIDFSIDQSDPREQIREYFIQYYKEWFLAKTTDWKSECEYRWIIHNTEKKPLFIPIQGAIKGVIVGPDFPKVYETTLIMLCKELNILAGKIEWWNGMPRVNLSAIFSP